MKRSHCIAIIVILSAIHIAAADDRPNIVFVLFDDMGWGQPQSYIAGVGVADAESRPPGQQGMRFTDAHSGRGGLHAHSLRRAHRSLSLAHRTVRRADDLFAADHSDRRA